MSSARDERAPRAAPATDEAVMHDAAMHDAADGHAREEDRLVALAGEAALARLDGVAPGVALLCDWMAHEARLAQSPAERRRTERAAARFARELLARHGLERARAEGLVRELRAAPAERAARGAAPLGEAVAHAAAEGCAPLLDLRVAAGDGRLLWDQACERWVTLPAGLPAGRYLAVGVAGDSMLPLLAPGDTLLVRLGAPPVPGTIVVARGRDEGYVVKQVGRVTARTVELRSLNPAYAPFRVRREAGAVLGAVVLRWRGGGTP